MTRWYASITKAEARFNAGFELAGKIARIVYKIRKKYIIKIAVQNSLALNSFSDMWFSQELFIFCGVPQNKFGNGHENKHEFRQWIKEKNIVSTAGCEKKWISSIGHGKNC